MATEKLAIIGGSSFLKSQCLSAFELTTVDTEHGKVLLRVNGDKTVYFVQRHHASPDVDYSPPHLINKLAIVSALKKLNITRVIAFGSVGSLRKSLPLGSLVMCDDYYNPFEPITFYAHEKKGHLVPGFDGKLRSEVLTVLQNAKFNIVTSGVYAQTQGPRFETPAEIKALALVADVVGMTCAHEATLCAELSLPYALICMVDNMANGIADHSLTHEEFQAGLARHEALMERVLFTVLQAFAPSADTADQDSPMSGEERKQRSVDLMVHARYVLPLDDDESDAVVELGVAKKSTQHTHARVLENHTVVVDQGLIVDILPTIQAQQLYHAREVVRHQEDHVLMPGLVNAHTHAGMTLMRGFSDDVCLIEWLGKNIWPAEAKFVSREFVRSASQLAIAESLRGGVTMMNDMYFFPEEMAKVVDETGIRATVGITMLEFPTNQGKGFDDYLAQGQELAAKYANHSRIKFSLAPHAPYTVSDAHWTVVANLAKQHNMQVHTHVHETDTEVNDSSNGNASMFKMMSEQQSRPLANLNRLEVVAPTLVSVHSVSLNNDDVTLLAKQHAHVVHCPNSNLKLSSGVCPVSKLHEAGVNVALGTDSSASNNALDMFSEMKIAALLAKGVAKEPRAVPASYALRMATINGARALNVQNVTGSLKVGKSADFISINFETLELLPLFDVVSHLVYACSRDRVRDVWVCGRRLLNNRRLTTLDEKAIAADAKMWGAKLNEYRKELAKTNAQ